MLHHSDLDAEQLAAIEYLQHRTESLVALPVGFGKTIIALTALKKVREVYGLWRTLLVSTKSICEHTWSDELVRWSHLPALKYACATGRNRAAALLDADITGVNFESLEWYLDLVDAGEVALPEILIIDESSKMKGETVSRVTRLAGLRRITKKDGVKHTRKYPGYVHRFKRRWLLSATPAPEGYQGLWAQEAVMSPRRRLGENPTSFRDQYCMRPRSGFGWVVVPSLESSIEEKLKHVMYLPKKEEYLNLLPATHSKVIVPWEAEARAQYDEMEDQLMLTLEQEDPDVSMDEIDIVAPNAGVLLSKLKQICSGFLYDQNKVAHPTADPDAKRVALDAVIERTGGSPLLVFTQFRAEREDLAANYRDAQIGLPRSLDDWSNNKIRMLVLHPKSAGHGVNLQYGTNVCIYYSLPDSFEQWWQSWGRLQRRGQTRPVSVLRMHRPNSVDSESWQRVQRKKMKLSDFLNNMRARRHEAG